MKIRILLLSALLMASPFLRAEETDSLRTVQMDEVVLVATPK